MGSNPIYAKQWRKKNKEYSKKLDHKKYKKLKEQSPDVLLDRALRYKYGINLIKYNEMLTEQNGVCKICLNKSNVRLSVDHCHITGMVRGLLCRTCNLGIGHLNENINNLYRAIDYLTEGMVKSEF